MDDAVRQQRPKDRERLSDDDFAALFDQLDRNEVAAMDRGLMRLVSSIEELRRRPMRR